jgi:hypothetical protein
LQVTVWSVWLFLEVPAKKECGSFFLEPRFLRIPGNSEDSCRNAQPRPSDDNKPKRVLETSEGKVLETSEGKKSEAIKHATK